MENLNQNVLVCGKLQPLSETKAKVCDSLGALVPPSLHNRVQTRSKLTVRVLLRSTSMLTEPKYVTHYEVIANK